MKKSTIKSRFGCGIIQCCIIYAIVVFPIFTFAQAGQWTWMLGDKTPGQIQTYNSLYINQTVFSSTENPSGLYEACQWTDTNGNFWFFGGVDSQGGINNDLWEYIPSINQWAWMNGTSTINDPGYYGTKGVSSLGNIPPSRSHGMASWTDKNNNLWFFGGGIRTTASFSDLWRYNIGTNEWTWMGGPSGTGNPGKYGVQGVPDTSNYPPNRAECAATWVDSSGDLWLFGGQNFGAKTSYNDLWRYHVATNTWTWMKGSNLPDKPSVYGTKKIEDAANTPGARSSYTHVTDDHNNLWLFGGTTITGVLLNDIWRYNPLTNNWVWLAGTNGGGSKSVFGTKCVADSTNIPGGRFENRACWKDKNGNLWFFGGFVSNSPSTPDVSNELWLYCIESNEWTFVNGDTLANPTGNWGTQGVSSATNKPDGRGGSLSWIDRALGNLYLFGGSTKQFPNSYNDVWRFNIDTTCGTCAAAVLPVANFKSDTVTCTGNCIFYTDSSTNATSWIWSFPGGIPSSSTDQNPFICYDTAGVYDVTLIATSYKGSSEIYLPHHIRIKEAPPIPNITRVHDDTLYCSTDTSYISYQWYIDTIPIQNATDSMLVINAGGNYNVKVTNYNQCTIAVGINIVGIKEFSDYGLQFTIYPNPVGNELRMKNEELRIGTINIYDVLGQSCLQSKITNLKSEISIDVSSLSSGVYFIQVSNDKGRWIGRFVKE